MLLPLPIIENLVESSDVFFFFGQNRFIALMICFHALPIILVSFAALLLGRKKGFLSLCSGLVTGGRYKQDQFFEDEQKRQRSKHTKDNGALIGALVSGGVSVGVSFMI